MSLNFTPTDTTYRYAWTNGHAEFRRDLVRLFRSFTPGRYLLTVCIQRGESRETIPSGERPVTAPLERGELLECECADDTPILVWLRESADDSVDTIVVRVRTEDAEDVDESDSSDTISLVSMAPTPRGSIKDKRGGTKNSATINREKWTK